MVSLILFNFLFPPPQSMYITAMTVIGFVASAYLGFMEIKGKHLQYSKFFNVGGEKNKLAGKREAQISSKIGMLVLYTPACIAGLSSLIMFPNEGLRFTLVRGALTIHFLKRVLEVLFVHKYSASIDVEDTIIISLSYFSMTATTIYAQTLTKGLQEPSPNLMYPGIAIFVVGIGGNMYHHYLLSTLRSGGEKEYKIPKGGLFNLVICPHYLFEIVGFIGITCIAQTTYAFSFTCGTILYLMGRSYSTRDWYRSKFEDFPKNVKALIPFIF
ncbi:dehydrogenase [Lithospermum erythrorhizon]|uniref:Dehydrogenase n=1 Tax=Lithospermum erythrorhizon TaxID=34254 RepID=A0AAV3RCB4_LITER